VINIKYGVNFVISITVVRGYWHLDDKYFASFTSCTTPGCELDVLTAGAFSIWRRRAPLPNSLAERFTKQLALDLRRFSR
jgi:hypothetical protein